MLFEHDTIDFDSVRSLLVIWSVHAIENVSCNQDQTSSMHVHNVMYLDTHGLARNVIVTGVHSVASSLCGALKVNLCCERAGTAHV